MHGRQRVRSQIVTLQIVGSAPHNGTRSGESELKCAQNRFHKKPSVSLETHQWRSIAVLRMN